MSGGKKQKKNNRRDSDDDSKRLRKRERGNGEDRKREDDRGDESATRRESNHHDAARAAGCAPLTLLALRRQARHRQRACAPRRQQGKELARPQCQKRQGDTASSLQAKQPVSEGAHEPARQSDSQASRQRDRPRPAVSACALTNLMAQELCTRAKNSVLAPWKWPSTRNPRGWLTWRSSK